MAISIAYTHLDLNNLSDPYRYFQGFEYQGQEQMESIIPERQNYGTETNSNNDFQGFEQAIDFVDSPPDSKEAWPTEYIKAGMHGPTIIETQQISANNRKRRMDWEPLDESPNSSSHDATIPEQKIPNLNGKDRGDRRRGPGRIGWADDIDLDLSGDLSNNGYISEALLAFNTHLTVFKQEIPSPTHDVQKTPRSPQEQIHRTIITDNRQSIVTQQQQSSGNSNNITNNNNSNSNNNNNSNNESNNNQMSQTQPQQNSGGIIEQNGTLSNISNLQQMLHQQNGFDARSSPTQQCEVGTFRKETNDDCSFLHRFQYVLAAPTSIATKNNEETLTYLNQGQSYEIKLKKLGDLSPFRGKILKSVIKICFHERRLQYMEKEQIQQWLISRPGERIIEVDVPLSYGLCHVSQSTNINLINTAEVHWDPMKEVGVYIKVNCISTEFTPKKHGGEKGVPFRIQVETYFENSHTFENILKPIHAAACQIKVFKLKGADRKHKQDREKILKRPPSEQEKYQPSCDCTILSDIPSETIVTQNCYSPEHVRPTVSPQLSSSPVHITKFDAMLPFTNIVNNQQQQSQITTTTSVSTTLNNNNNNNNNNINNNGSPTNSNICKIIDQSMLSPHQVEMEEFIPIITKDSTPTQLTQWMTYHRLTSYLTAFANFTGADLLRMSKDDLVQICGLPDGIRLFNILHVKAIQPRLTIYVSLDANSYNAIYLHLNTTKELIQKLFLIPGLFDNTNNSNMVNGSGGGGANENNLYWGLHSKYSESGSNLYDTSKLMVYINGPAGVQVLVTDEVLANIKDESLFSLEIQNGKVLMKAVYKNEI